MAEPLKHQYGPEIPRRIAAMIAAVRPAFDATAFTEAALQGYDALELMPRGRHLAQPFEPGKGFGVDGLVVGRGGAHQGLHEGGKVVAFGEGFGELPSQPGAQVFGHQCLCLAFFVAEGQHLHEAAVHDERGQAFGGVDMVALVAGAGLPGALCALLLQGLAHWGAHASRACSGAHCGRGGHRACSVFVAEA